MSNGKINIQDNNKSIVENVEHDDIVMNLHAKVCLQQLIRVWLGFERDLSTIPLLRRLDLGTYTVDDHLCLLRNLRQQVIEGSRWITRTASSFDRNYAEIRSTIISHAVDEHRDYELLEKDFVATGGKLEDILSSNFSSSAIDKVNISSKGFNADIHASAEYRAHIIKVMAKKAVSSC